ncbi:MAG: transmembrane Fragile-X-F protein [Clostridia bacterium]|nr:transmembrane Fragile-X-F protein [Clostridia bacterium]
MGLTEVLTIVFVVLKLLGKIGWSWWLVLLPEIIGFVIYVGLLVLYVYQKVSAEKEIKQSFKEWRR